MATPPASHAASLLIDMHGSLAKSRILRIMLELIQAGDGSQAFWLGLLGATLTTAEYGSPARHAV